MSESVEPAKEKAEKEPPNVNETKSKKSGVRSKLDYQTRQLGALVSLETFARA